jgi:riboflavin kinase/FMN adenylyltransferase
VGAIYKLDEALAGGVLKDASCTFGVFDGFHVGHQYLVQQAIETNDVKGAKSVAITFDIDPDEVFHPDRLRKLVRNADRIDMLCESGIDAVVVIPFTPDFYSLSPDAFLESTFAQNVPAHLHVGEDFRFGARAAGTVDDLKRWASVCGCQIHAHHLVSADGKPITATRIRKLLHDCKIQEANRLLGRPYFLRETVHAGRGEGADMGFRTANLIVAEHDLTLGEGVYAAYATVNGTKCKAAVSVGVSPTFEDRTVANVEVHILDFDADLVGKAIKVEFMEFLRPMIKFDDVDELIAAVKANIEWVRTNL